MQGFSQYNPSQSTLSQQIQQGFQALDQLWPDLMCDPVSGHLLGGMDPSQDPGQLTAGIQPAIPNIQHIWHFSNLDMNIIMVSSASIIYLSIFVKLQYQGVDTSELHHVQ